MIRISILIVMVSLFSWIPGYSQENVPKASLSNIMYDFGTVLRGTKVEIAVAIRNEGTADLNIAGVQAAMAALQIEVQRVIQPGQETKLRLALDTAAYLGDVEGKLVILTNDPQSPNLKFEIKGHVESKVTLQPNPPVFLQAFRWDAEKKEEVISIQSRDEKPLKIMDVKTEGDQFLTKLSTLHEGKHYQLSVKMNPKGAPARAVGLITIVTESEKIKFPVYTFLKDKVYTSPAGVFFAPVSLEEVAKNPKILDFRKQSVFVYQYQGTDFQIKIESLPEYVSVERTPATGPGSVVEIPNQGKTSVFELIFSPNKEHLKAGSFQDTITITTNDPEFPVLKIPVRLEVRSAPISH